MSTREVADYLRIKERKVYDLVRDRRIPCSRVTGKWLFPRALIDQWVAQNTQYSDSRMPVGPPPPIIAGSHDPLLDWAVREARCGLASMPGGSLDGLRRIAEGSAAIAGLHILDAESGGFNGPALARHLRGVDAVAVEWAAREQGLVLAPGNPLGIAALGDLAARRARVVPRQPEAGSQLLLAHLLAQAGVRMQDLALLPQPALSENDLGLAIVEGRADAGLAIRAVATQYRLAFVPLARERFDLAMRRRDYFEPPVQSLLAFARGEAFAARAAALGGYDIGHLGRVTWNP